MLETNKDFDSTGLSGFIRFTSQSRLANQTSEVKQDQSRASDRPLKNLFNGSFSHQFAKGFILK